MKWACLLHDVRKLSVPIIEGKDHVHPFKSSISTLEVFENLKFIPESARNAECLMQARRLIGESVQPIPARDQERMEHGVPLCTQMHSHHNLPEIFWYLWHEEVLRRNGFVDLVFRLVMFHQSLDGVKDWPSQQYINN